MKNTVGHEIHAAANLLGRRIEYERKELELDEISPMQSWILSYLHDHKDREVFQRDIERDFTITRSTVTGTLQQMEKRGYITRQAVPKDARLKKIILTAKGEAMRQKVTQHIEATEKALLKDFSTEERERFIAYLQRVQDNLR